MGPFPNTVIRHSLYCQRCRPHGRYLERLSNGKSRVASGRRSQSAVDRAAALKCGALMRAVPANHQPAASPALRPASSQAAHGLRTCRLPAGVGRQHSERSACRADEAGEAKSLAERHEKGIGSVRRRLGYVENERQQGGAADYSDGPSSASPGCRRRHADETAVCA